MIVRFITPNTKDRARGKKMLNFRSGLVGEEGLTLSLSL